MPCAQAAAPVPVTTTPPAPTAECGGPPSALGAGFEAQVEENVAAANATRAELLDPEVMTVITCGTGSPLPSDRAQACTAVFANGTFLLFDAGDGAARSLEALLLPVTELTAVFVTHFHSDHIADVGEVISRSWILGRTTPLAIHGGPGVDRLVDGFNLIYSLDDAYRTAHHGEEIFPPGSGRATATTIPAPGPEGSVVYDVRGVTVTAYEVNHAPIAPAYAYRVEYGGRSVTISGDTTDAPGFRAASAGADVLVSEVMNKDFVEQAECAFGRLGQEVNAAIFRDIRTYHIDAPELGQLVQAQGVGQLVLTHQVPAVPAMLQDLIFRTPVATAYQGTVVVAEDGTRVTLTTE